MAKLGFVGLGVMGGPMAGHLISVGHEVTVWNRTSAKTKPLADLGAKVADSIEDLAKDKDAVMLCVSRSEDAKECLLAMAATAAPGTLFIDHSTIAPAVARELYGELKKRGFRFVDAPVTGGSMGAQKGQLTLFCGGDEADVAEVIKVTKGYSKRAERVGGPGAGQMMKLANQIAVGGALISLCECLAFAKEAGLDLTQAKEMIGGGAGGGWCFENYGPKILNADWSPGFTITNQRKDFRYCLQAAQELGMEVPGTLLVHELLGELEESGKGDLTTAALYTVLTKDA